MERTEPAVPNIQSYFASVQDSRNEMNREHLLLDIVVIAICAIITGTDDWVVVADFTFAIEQLRQPLERNLLPLFQLTGALRSPTPSWLIVFSSFISSLIASALKVALYCLYRVR